MKREGADSHHVNFASIADTHRHLILSQAPFILQLLLRVTNMSNRAGIKYPVVTPGASKVNINNMYITYTFLVGNDLASLLVRQVLGAVALPVSVALAVEADHAGLGARLGRLGRGGSSWFARLLRLALLPLCAGLLEFHGLVDKQDRVLQIGRAQQCE